MSEVQQSAVVTMMLADYAVSDQLGKLQMIGGGLQVLARDHNTGATAPFAVVVSMSFPAQVFNEQYAFELVLEDAAGAPAAMSSTVTGPAGAVPGGGSMRFGQNLQVEEPSFPGAGVPRRAMPARSQVVLHFNNGLPLPAGQVLTWRVRIDGDSKPEWSLPFFVAAPATGPVVG
ncbi:hypothetical protein [Nakamurella aerolata]|uniref:Uncharacterized protein n=1 Tax=Nakamurella aerolata TaxID=1656892 RepID=A0A849A6F9_9ACTN|nr:hypothetical protein [Nakamurella aerolata]NNG34611.1 hypothetical protein [Nakamurella aerolata]